MSSYSTKNKEAIWGTKANFLAFVGCKSSMGHPNSNSFLTERSEQYIVAGGCGKLCLPEVLAIK